MNQPRQPLKLLRCVSVPLAAPSLGIIFCDVTRTIGCACARRSGEFYVKCSLVVVRKLLLTGFKAGAPGARLPGIRPALLRIKSRLSCELAGEACAISTDGEFVVE